MLLNQACISNGLVSEIINGECDAMVYMTLNDFQTNKGQVHSFWYLSISHIWLL